MSVLLAVTVGVVFFLLLLATGAQQDAADRAIEGRRVLQASDQMGLLIVDLETGQRGFIITSEEIFLEPWTKALAAFPSTSAKFQSLANESGDSSQAADARKIVQMTADYINNYSVPLVKMTRTDLRAAQSPQVTAEGKLLVDQLRSELAGFNQDERQLLTERQAAANADAMRATVAAGVGLGISVLMVLFSGSYLARRVVRPVREVAGMAGRVAGGDLTVRMPGTGPGAVGVLQRAFNTMTGSLQHNQVQLRRAADEQAALRRVATLVASGAPPPEVFAAVAAETGAILGAAFTAMARYAADDTVIVVGAWAASGDDAQAELGVHWLVEEDSIPAQVRRTGQGAQREYTDASGELGAWARKRGLLSAVGSPVFVEGQLWGFVTAFAGAGGLSPADVQARMQAFTELAAMAVANSASREQLAASRARVVAAADESRRRIERDLHDGTQQRLISLTLEMRATASRIPPEQAELREQWEQTARHLAEVTDDLREVTRGLHPAILATGGLGPALRALARRSAVPVDLSVGFRERLPEHTEITAYYVVSEALTNVAKHAQASLAQVDVERSDGSLSVRVCDDGIGGADPARGSGLVGLSDRVEAARGQIKVESPPGGGTSLLVTIPVSQWQEDSGGGS